jgi:hypothetical protein
MDPRSNVHVINDSKAWRWTHTRYGAAYETLFAGAQAVPISEWVTVVIPIRTPSSTQDI